MPHHGMTPHISGSSLSAQARYAAVTREILECHFAGKPIRTEYLIVDMVSSQALAPIPIRRVMPRRDQKKPHARSLNHPCLM